MIRLGYIKTPPTASATDTWQIRDNKHIVGHKACNLVGLVNKTEG